MKEKTDKLLVSWKGPQTKSNYFVGLLTKHQNKESLYYTFIYIEEVVAEAKKEGFSPFVGLKDLKKEYKSDKLFSVFERRLPNQNRNIFKKAVQQHHLEESADVTWEYLKLTKGKTATDQLSILEPITMENNRLSYRGEVAGWSFTKDQNKTLKIRDELVLCPAKDNEEDNQAVEILHPANNKERVGYIQRPYNQVFFHLLNQGYSFQAVIDSINTQNERPTIIVKAKVFPWDLKDKNFNYMIEWK